MEELRSTEALDREILEDARKRAHEILLSAEDTLGSQTREWDGRIRTALDNLNKSYEERTKKIEEEVFARLPLDKRRLRSEAAEITLNKAMDGFLHSLTREKLLLILNRELSGRLRSWAGNREGIVLKAVVRYSNLSLSEVEVMLEKAPFNGEWDINEDTAIYEYPAISISTPTMKINATVETAAAAQLMRHRAELSASLLGEEVLND